MTRTSTALSLLAGLAFSLAGTGVGLAQDQYGPPPGPPGPNGAPPPQTPASQATRLRQTLRLRPDQEGALQAFIASQTPPPGAMDRMRRQEEDSASLPTPARLDFMMARMDEMRGLMVTRIAATKRFYAGLTPAQQGAFDALQPSDGGR
ncbi:MAG: Spy/CpxP family protein refolding chaperone [Caulobacteraceae bacterium]